MNVLKSMSAASLFLAGVLLLTVNGEVFDCDTFNPDICTMDLIPFCLTNGTVVKGRCYAQRAVCLEQATLDDTFAACNHQERFDCNNFNPMKCTRDAIPFCLHNGTVMRGTCQAKKAVCLENQSVDNDFSACNKAGSDGQTGDGDDDSAATSISAAVSLLLSLLMCSVLSLK